MIDEVHASGIGGGRAVPPRRTERSGGTPKDAPQPRLIEVRNRLGGISDELERLLTRLSSLQDRAHAGSQLLERLRAGSADAPEIPELARRAFVDPADPGSMERAVRTALDDTERARHDLERSISSAQVALQNVLSATTEEPGLPPGAPPMEGLSFDRRNVLQLLDRPP
ncbi:MAG: hypothetical protein HYY17_16035 [Planctomycetes bacterium]|nr:hypothetical protein [Planctomycetota bacterium]